MHPQYITVAAFLSLFVVSYVIENILGIKGFKGRALSVGVLALIAAIIIWMLLR